jgi:hypothetical protein
MKCLEKDRTRRYDTANGVALDIERHLNHEPVLARPPSAGYRLQKSFRRNKLVFTAAGVVVLALVLGVAISSWQAIRATKAGRREAEAHRQADQAARVADVEREQAEKEAQKARASELAARQNLYAADMSLVEQAWEQNNVSQVRLLLEETATYPGRGFEWYYWQRQTHLELQTLRGHSGIVVRVAFSPDGRRIVTGSEDGTAKVWDAASGKELLTLRGHSDRVWSVAFSQDGRRIVTGSEDGTARVWAAASVAQADSWRQEEQESAERLTAQEREQAETEARDRALCAQDEGAIKRWLVLLPIGYEGRDGARVLREEQVAQEGQLHPHAGERSRAGQSELIWRAVKLEDYRVDFNALAGGVTEWSVVYAVAYIQSEAAQNNVVLKIGSDDEARVYLNGKLIHEWLTVRGYDSNEDVVGGLELKAGINVLVFKVVNEVTGWEGSVRFTDAAGQQLKGIRVTLDPAGRD